MSWRYLKMYPGKWKSALNFRLAGVTCCVPLTFEGDCFKIILSKTLGLGIIAGSLLVKVPQIMKIMKHKSAKGINKLSVLLDLLAITCSMAYSYVSGFPFTSWGDGAFLTIQTALILALALYFEKSTSASIAFLLMFGGTLLMIGSIPIKILWYLQAFNIPILLVGKFSQAWSNFANKSTGQLSATTSVMLLAGSLARIFTSIQETGDDIIVLTYFASSLANSIIVIQILFYWVKPSKTTSTNTNTSVKSADIRKNKKQN